MDITAFKATVVPVGEDQAPLIEQTNELVRRINRQIGHPLLPEARALIPNLGRLPGVDGKAKMSKSQGNAVPLSASDEEIATAAAAALFKAKQSGLATYAGTFNDEDGIEGPIGVDYYTGADTTVTGAEAEVSGRVANHWLLSAGYTHLKIKDNEGQATQAFIPRNSFKLGATYEMPEWHELKLGAQFRYQSRISSTDDTGGLPIRQKGYAVLDLLAGFKPFDHLQASVNVRNVTNVKHLNSLEWGQAYYAAPRSVVGTLRFEY